MGRMAENLIRLLGPPAVESPDATPPQPRGRKAWAVLAYLALQAEGTGRSRTASLLFPDAADPLGALRWNLSELRRVLPGVTVAGDPLRLVLQPPWRCDVLEVVGPAAKPGLDPRGFTGQLLEGLSFADCPVFDSWLADQRFRLDNAVQSLLYEAALAALASDAPGEAAELATLALHRDPFHADCNAVLVKALVALGEHRRARRHVTQDPLATEPRIAVEAPHECDADMQRDGVVLKPPSGRGERSWWLGQLVEAAPLSAWTERFGGRSAQEIADEVLALLAPPDAGSPAR